METVSAAITDSVITVSNGVVAFGAVLFSPVALAVLVTAAGLAWLSSIEIEELTRQGTKPDMQLH